MGCVEIVSFYDERSTTRADVLSEVGRSDDVSWMIFNVFIWAQLELQLGIMCATAPALRVFFRRYLSPSRIFFTNSYETAGRSQRRSALDPENVQVMSAHDEHNHEDFADGRHNATKSLDASEADFNSWSPSTTAPSERWLFKGAADGEKSSKRNTEKFRMDWNMEQDRESRTQSQNSEKKRESIPSVKSPSFVRTMGRGGREETHNFSLPLQPMPAHTGHDRWLV